MRVESVSRDGEGAVVRQLRAQDLEPVIALDAKVVGRRREEYFKLKLKQALSDTGIQVSLGAEIEGMFVGFLLARVYYGEFGAPEPVAVLDTMGVHPGFRGRGVAAELIDQLRTNLLGLGIRTLQTEVSWQNPGLLAFFQHKKFQPTTRFYLDLDLKKTRKN